MEINLIPVFLIKTVFINTTALKKANKSREVTKTLFAGFSLIQMQLNVNSAKLLFIFHGMCVGYHTEILFSIKLQWTQLMNCKLSNKFNSKSDLERVAWWVVLLRQEKIKTSCGCYEVRWTISWDDKYLKKNRCWNFFKMKFHESLLHQRQEILQFFSWKKMDFIQTHQF